LERRYEVKREYAFEKDRMDLFICDEINRFVIENKIYASVSGW
jgi:hypothetical protein